MAITVQDLVNQALLDMHSIAQGETPNSVESGVALNQLNRILSSLSLDGTFVYTQAVGTFALTANVGAYTMGAGGTWATTARPVRIKGAHVSFNGLKQGVAVLPMGAFADSLQSAEKAGVVEYLATGLPVSPALATWAIAGMPTRLGEDSAAPLKNIRVYPIQNVGASIDVSYWIPLTAFAALTDNVAFPVPGYELMLINELTVVLAPDYGRSADLQTYMAIAARSKARINEVNAGIELPPPPPPPQK